MIEEKCGITFACGPAVRQFFAYRARTGTFLPSRQRAPPNEDFTRMRHRITLRDIVWFRPTAFTNSAVSRDPDVEATAKTSVLDMLWGRLQYSIPGVSSNSRSTVDVGDLKENKRRLREPSAEHGNIEERKKIWTFLPRGTRADNSSNATSAPFLHENSGISMTTSGEHPRDFDLSEMLADPVRSLVPADQRLQDIIRHLGDIVWSKDAGKSLLARP